MKFDEVTLEVELRRHRPMKENLCACGELYSDIDEHLSFVLMRAIRGREPKELPPDEREVMVKKIIDLERHAASLSGNYNDILVQLRGAREELDRARQKVRELKDELARSISYRKRLSDQAVGALSNKRRLADMVFGVRERRAVAAMLAVLKENEEDET